MGTAAPPKPNLNKDVIIKFKDKNREKFIGFLNEALKQRAWSVPIKTNDSLKQTLP